MCYEGRFCAKWRSFRETLYRRFRKQRTSAQPLDQPHLDLLLLAKRSGEADLRSVVSSYSVGGSAFCLSRLDYRAAVVDKIVGAWRSVVEHFGVRGTVIDAWEPATSTVDYRGLGRVETAAGKRLRARRPRRLMPRKEVVR